MLFVVLFGLVETLVHKFPNRKNIDELGEMDEMDEIVGPSIVGLVIVSLTLSVVHMYLCCWFEPGSSMFTAFQTSKYV